MDAVMQIAVVALDNYNSSQSTEESGASQESSHNWVNEVVRCEARGLSGIGTDINSNILGRPRPEIRDTSLLTRFAFYDDITHSESYLTAYSGRYQKNSNEMMKLLK